MSNLHFELYQVKRFLKTAKTIKQARQGTQIRKQYLRKWYSRDYTAMSVNDDCQEIKRMHANMYIRILGVRK